MFNSRAITNWAPRADVPTADIFSILETLRNDPTRYVTRSVANTLNDLSKLEPDQVVATLDTWCQQPGPDTPWLTRHALRTLVKQDHQDALALLGYPVKPEFSVSGIEAPTKVLVGEKLSYQCTLKSKDVQNLRIALRVHYLKANGTHTTRVFAVKDIAASKGEVVQIDKAISFRPITTRTMYPGTHHIELVVNGVKRGKRTFELVEA